MEPAAECMLIVIGAALERKEELVGSQVGTLESAPRWRERVAGFRKRGCAAAPKIPVGDGAMCFSKVLDEVFPGTRRQNAGSTRPLAR